jgi:hypothetical protein
MARTTAGMIRIACGMLFSIASISAAASAEGRPSYQSLWATATQKPGCTPADYPDLVVVTCREELTLWYFTKPGHPAHPGVIKRTIVLENGVWNAYEHGYSFASDEAQPAFKRWLAEIVDLDRQMREALEKQHGAGPSQSPN